VREIMGIEDLNELEIVSGSFSLAFVIISLIIGFMLISKYFSLKNRILLTVGLSWIFLSSSWWSRSISFLTIILFDYSLDEVLYLFLLNAFVPLAILCWIYSFFSLVYTDFKKRIFIVYLVICIVYEVFLIIFLFTNTELIGSVQFFSARGGPLSIVFQIFAIFSFLITGILFARKSLESNDPKIQLKGKLLLVAFISFTISALYESIMPLTPLTLALIRILLISSAIEYFFGFFLPDRLADLLIKQKK
jgi:uncharacterized integral membrane protein